MLAKTLQNIINFLQRILANMTAEDREKLLQVFVELWESLFRAYYRARMGQAK